MLPILTIIVLYIHIIQKERGGKFRTTLPIPRQYPKNIINKDNQNENIINSGGIDPDNCIHIGPGGININNDEKLLNNDVLITDVKVSSLNNVIDGIPFQPLTQTTPINDTRLFRENEIRLFLGNELEIREKCVEKIIDRFRRLHKYGIKCYEDIYTQCDDDMNELIENVMEITGSHRYRILKKLKKLRDE